MKLIFDKIIGACPLCGKHDFQAFGGREHFGYRIDYKICNFCTLVFMDPQMSEKSMEAFYKDEYRKLYQGNESPTKAEIDFQFKRGRNQAGFLKSVLGNKSLTIKSYLDIGCSAGSLLASIKECFSEVNLFGIEPGDSYRSYCETQGITVFKDILDLEASKLSFEAISLSHVLEHIPDPVAYLSRLREKFLTEFGIIMIEVPNTTGGHGAFEVAHPICFTRKTLEETMRAAGFDQILISTHNATQEDQNLELYLLAVGFNSSKVGFKIKKGNAALTKFLRRRGFKKESLFTSVKVLVKDYLTKLK